MIFCIIVFFSRNSSWLQHEKGWLFHFNEDVIRVFSLIFLCTLSCYAAWWSVQSSNKAFLGLSCSLLSSWHRYKRNATAGLDDLRINFRPQISMALPVAVRRNCGMVHLYSVDLSTIPWMAYKKTGYNLSVILHDEDDDIKRFTRGVLLFR